MMWFFISVISLLTSVALGADHDTYRNCSRVPFCASLRNQSLDSDSQFAAKTSDFVFSKRVALIPLYNAKNESLSLQISLLGQSKVRIKVLELNHSRYELSDVLVDEPEVLTLTSVNFTNTSLSLTLRDDVNEYTVVINNGPPFTVQCYFQNRLQVVLNGERLVIENTDDSKAFSFSVEFDKATNLLGLFHHAYKMTLGETADGSSDPFRLRNSGTTNYEADSPMALYGSIPVIYGHLPAATSAIFLHNAAEQWVDISYKGSRPSAYFMVESGTFDLFVLLGPYPDEVVKQYTSLTGVAHMPQLWTLGYHQSRFSYETQEDVKEVVAKMDAHDFPMDAIWLDVGHTYGNRYFEWNPENFNDPIEMQQNISSTGRKIVVISDPHIKVDSDYSIFVNAKANEYFVKWANGSDFEGDCRPGLSSWIDFFNPDANDYYANLYSYDKFNGSTETLAGIWNDMNEPTVYSSLERTLPFETLHYGDILHRDVHNIYGLLQTKATHEGLMKRDNGTKRPFILTRSYFAGSQRYAAMWTGDNTANWPYLSLSFAECMTANLLGVVFCGADVGGFFDDPDEELIQRWYQAAIWLPFFRGHSNQDTARREPYLFSEDVQANIRKAIKLRYKHIPVWYTLFYEHTRYGEAIIRPLFYTFHSYIYNDEQMLIGENIMVRPVMEPNITRFQIAFPYSFKPQYWYRVDDESWIAHYGGGEENITVDITTTPLFYRAGSIIARKDREKSSTLHMIDDPYTFYVNLDTLNMADGRLYVDDYTSFEYSTRNSYLYVTLTYMQDTHAVHIDVIDGDPSDIYITLQSIIIHKRSSVGNGTTLETIHNTTVDGTPLHTIDIVKHLLMRSEGLTLYL